jgi:hypothetical protein
MDAHLSLFQNYGLVSLSMVLGQSGLASASIGTRQRGRDSRISRCKFHRQRICLRSRQYLKTWSRVAIPAKVAVAGFVNQHRRIQDSRCRTPERSLQMGAPVSSATFVLSWTMIFSHTLLLCAAARRVSDRDGSRFSWSAPRITSAVQRYTYTAEVQNIVRPHGWFLKMHVRFVWSKEGKRNWSEDIPVLTCAIYNGIRALDLPIYRKLHC